MSATIFTVKRSEIEGRLDPFFYRPDFMELEKLMKKIGAQPLRKFVKGIASGATPKADEYEKYYSDKENGIPFLRVQNLSPTSILNYEDCKSLLSKMFIQREAMPETSRSQTAEVLEFFPASTGTNQFL